MPAIQITFLLLYCLTLGDYIKYLMLINHRTYLYHGLKIGRDYIAYKLGFENTFKIAVVKDIK